MFRTILFITLCLALSGCNTLSQKRAEHVDSPVLGETGELVSLPSQLRTIAIKKAATSYLSCSEPAPDTALSDTFKLVTGISKNKSSSTATGEDSTTASNIAGINNDFQTSTTALELAGRTQVVLLAREFMYRTCEAASNGWLDKADVKANHKSIIEQITNLIKADTAKQEKKAADAETKASVAKKLEIKALTSAATFFDSATAKHCLSNYDSCITKAAGDAAKTKACKTEHTNCTN